MKVLKHTLGKSVQSACRHSCFASLVKFGENKEVTSVWIAQNPNAGQNMQHLFSIYRLAEQAFDQFLQENDRKAVAAMKK